MSGNGPDFRPMRRPIKHSRGKDGRATIQATAPRRGDQICTPTPCGWIWTGHLHPASGSGCFSKTSPRPRRSFLLSMRDSCAGPWPPSGRASAGGQRTRPRFDECPEDCICWQVEPDPSEDDWGPWRSVYVRVEVAVRGEQGSDTTTVVGSVRKRKVSVRGVCASPRGVRDASGTEGRMREGAFRYRVERPRRR